MLLSIPAVIVSATIVLLIAYRDPKRLRAAASGRAARGRKPLQALAPASRRLLAAALLLPGVLLALAGESAAFMIWLGAVTALGWVAAQLLAPAARPPRKRVGA